MQVAALPDTKPYTSSITDHTVLHQAFLGAYSKLGTYYINLSFSTKAHRIRVYAMDQAAEKPRKCPGLECENDASTLQCPTCLKQGIERYFCSQDCFKRSWVGDFWG